MWISKTTIHAQCKTEFNNNIITKVEFYRNKEHIKIYLNGLCVNTPLPELMMNTHRDFIGH